MNYINLSSKKRKEKRLIFNHISTSILPFIVFLFFFLFLQDLLLAGDEATFTEKKNSNLMIILDTSNSMHYTTDKRFPYWDDYSEVPKDSGDDVWAHSNRVYTWWNGADGPDSKLFQAKQAINEVLPGASNINVGFATLAQYKRRKSVYGEFKAGVPARCRLERYYWEIRRDVHYVQLNCSNSSDSATKDEFGRLLVQCDYTQTPAKPTYFRWPICPNEDITECQYEWRPIYEITNPNYPTDGYIDSDPSKGFEVTFYEDEDGDNSDPYDYLDRSGTRYWDYQADGSKRGSWIGHHTYENRYDGVVQNITLKYYPVCPRWANTNLYYDEDSNIWTYYFVSEEWVDSPWNHLDECPESCYDESTGLCYCGDGVPNSGESYKPYEIWIASSSDNCEDALGDPDSYLSDHGLNDYPERVSRRTSYGYDALMLTCLTPTERENYHVQDYWWDHYRASCCYCEDEGIFNCGIAGGYEDCNCSGDNCDSDNACNSNDEDNCHGDWCPWCIGKYRWRWHESEMRYLYIDAWYQIYWDDYKNWNFEIPDSLDGSIFSTYSTPDCDNRPGWYYLRTPNEGPEDVDRYHEYGYDNDSYFYGRCYQFTGRWWPSGRIYYPGGLYTDDGQWKMWGIRHWSYYNFYCGQDSCSWFNHYHNFDYDTQYEGYPDPYFPAYVNDGYPNPQRNEDCSVKSPIIAEDNPRNYDKFDILGRRKDQKGFSDGNICTESAPQQVYRNDNLVFINLPYAVENGSIIPIDDTEGSVEKVLKYTKVPELDEDDNPLNENDGTIVTIGFKYPYAYSMGTWFNSERWWTIDEGVDKSDLRLVMRYTTMPKTDSVAAVYNEGGLTPLFDALMDVKKYYEEYIKKDSATLDGCRNNFILLITDGRDNTTLARPQEEYNPKTAAAALCNLSVNGVSTPVKTFVIGFGQMESEEEDQLNAIAEAGCTEHAYFAENLEELKVKIQEILNVIKAGAYTRSNPVFTNTGNSMVSSFFEYPSYRGHVAVYKVNSDGYIITRMENDGITCSNPEGIKNWEADYLLNKAICEEGYSWRNIFTIGTDGETLSFNDGNVATLKNKIGDISDFNDGDIDTSDAPYGDNDYDALINYVRGDSSFESRNGGILKDRDGTSRRDLCDGSVNSKECGWYLGDPIHGNPVLVGGPSYFYSGINCNDTINFDQYKPYNPDGATPPPIECYWQFKKLYSRRIKVLYVPTNEGMVHAFVYGYWVEGDDPDTPKKTEEGYWEYDAPNDPSDPSGTLNRFGRKAVYTTIDGKTIYVGKELWAYIPSNLISKLKYLAMPGHAHQAMVDLTPRAFDVYIDIGNGKEWRTVIIGGERGGGDLYFCIDVTDPMNPRVLWEFSVLLETMRMVCQQITDSVQREACFNAIAQYVQDGSYREFLENHNIAVSWSQPDVGRVSLTNRFPIPDPYIQYPVYPSPVVVSGGTKFLSSGDRWLAFITGGFTLWEPWEDYKSTHSVPVWPSGFNFDEVFSKIYAFAIDIETGFNLLSLLPSLTPSIDMEDVGQYICSNSADGSIPTCTDGVHYDFIPPVVSNPSVVDLDGDGYVDRIYGGSTAGGLFSIYLYNDGSIISVSGTSITGVGACPGLFWTRCIARDDYNKYRGCRQPITAEPVIAVDDEDYVRVYFGTGQYDNLDSADSDKQDEARMAFYCLVDQRRTEKTCPSDNGYYLSYMVNNGHVIVNSALNPLSGSWVYDLEEANLVEHSNPYYPEKIDKPHYAERVLSKAAVVGGIVFFTTFLPTDEFCTASGFGRLYALDYKTGGSPSFPVLDINGDGVVDENDKIVKNGSEIIPPYIQLGEGLPSSPYVDVNNEVVTVQMNYGEKSPNKIQVKVDLPSPPLKIEAWKELLE